MQRNEREKARQDALVRTYLTRHIAKFVPIVNSMREGSTILSYHVSKLYNVENKSRNVLSHEMWLKSDKDTGK